MDPICPSLEFYERKVKEHGGTNRQTFVYMGQQGDKATEENLVAVVVEANDGEVFIITATPKEGNTQYNHRFVFNDASYEEVCKDPLSFIDDGINLFLEMIKLPCKGMA